MTDTQWPRFIVFQQEKEGQPHQYAGSVHAPDAEMALMNARDVFVRRPTCISLWVVPDSVIFARTAEQLESATSQEENVEKTTPNAAYSVFQKVTHKGTYVHAGDLNGLSPELALSAAFETVAKRSALAWWVLPTRFVTHSTPEDIETLFRPALNKNFRDQSFYHTVAAMQQIRTQSQDTPPDER
jgi:ring-1,2-phenylacetyl-CoA epoxidase subunit PaaB